MHDYGFYKFEKFENYTDSVDALAAAENSQEVPECNVALPLFQERNQFLRYDECSQLIGACMQFMELRLKDKQKEQKIAWSIAKRVFAHFDWNFIKGESKMFMQGKIEELLKT